MDVNIILDNQISIISIITMLIILIGFIIAIWKKTMITYAIIIINFIVFVLSILYSPDIKGSSYGFIENNIINIVIENPGLGFRPIYFSPEYFQFNYTLLSSMFVHSGFLHIFGNMLIFFFMGIAFENRIGWKKFLIIYIFTGIFASLIQAMVNILSPTQFTREMFDSTSQFLVTQAFHDMGAISMVGASGAIFGILGAFAFSYPRDEVVLPIPVGFIGIITRVKVIYAALLFAGIETFIAWVNNPLDMTAHYAHLGGLASGFILAAFIIRGKTHTEKGQTIYYDSFAPQINREIDFDKLREFADTPELISILDKIEKETVPQVREIWLDHFFEKAKCPRCKGDLKHINGRVTCSKCGFKKDI